MDVERCRVLMEAVACGNIRRAAGRLGYTPSGVSRSVATLERDVGFALLVRSRQGVAPTPACEELMPALRRAVAAADAADERARAIAGVEVGSVRIGTAYVEFYPQLTAAIARFGERHPGVQVSLREGTSSELVDAIEAGELEVAVVTERPGRHAWTRLVGDELAVLVPADHELAQAGAYPLERLERDPFIEIMPGVASDNSIVLRRYGIEPNVRFSVSDDQAGYAMVDAGLGVTLSNGLHLRGRGGTSVVLPVEPAVRFSLGVATPVEDVMSPAAKAFAEVMISVLGTETRSNN